MAVYAQGGIREGVFFNNCHCYDVSMVFQYEWNQEGWVVPQCQWGGGHH